MNKPFFLYTLDDEDLESCLDVMDKNITPETVEKLKRCLMWMIENHDADFGEEINSFAMS